MKEKTKQKILELFRLEKYAIENNSYASNEQKYFNLKELEEAIEDFNELLKEI